MKTSQKALASTSAVAKKVSPKTAAATKPARTGIKRGVPAEVVGILSGKMSTPKEWLIATLGLSRATLSRKERERKALSKDESERVLGVQALIGQVEHMVRESGDPGGFDAAKWLSEWLRTAVPALGGNTPAGYLDTIEGQKLVSNLLAMGQSGAYA